MKKYNQYQNEIRRKYAEISNRVNGVKLPMTIYPNLCRFDLRIKLIRELGVDKGDRVDVKINRNAKRLEISKSDEGDYKISQNGMNYYFFSRELIDGLEGVIEFNEPKKEIVFFTQDGKIITK